MATRFRIGLVVFGLAVAATAGLIARPLARNWSYLMDLSLAREERVERARRYKGETVRAMAADAGLKYPVAAVYFRAFKEERALELWGADKAGQPMARLGRFRIAGMSGSLGPKRKSEDLQVPEGLYVIDRFNPRSRFRLSLGIDYPNASDRILSDREQPGGDIFIHGDTRSIGCLAMTDEVIDALYLISLDARTSGQRRIPVHIFPFEMTAANMKRHSLSPHLAFWRSLRPAFSRFESKRILPAWSVEADGSYSFDGS